MTLDTPTTPQATITTARFDLRPLQRSDLGLIEVYAADRRVAEMTTTLPHPLPPGMIDAFITRATAEPRDQDVWIIDGLKTDGAEVMGLVTLSRLDRNQSEISFWVAPAFWNTHLASDAVKAIVAMNPAQNAAMFASVLHDNPASARVLTNAGFQYLGDAEVFCLAREAALPTWTYSYTFS